MREFRLRISRFLSSQEWPHKYGTTYESEADVQTPREKHPIFYGCFDWHSAVHGHWLMAEAANRKECAEWHLSIGTGKAMNSQSPLFRFPGTELASQIEVIFDAQFTEDKVAVELELFAQEYNYSFERTYGWAWLLKLQQVG